MGTGAFEYNVEPVLASKIAGRGPLVSADVNVANSGFAFNFDTPLLSITPLRQKIESRIVLQSGPARQLRRMDVLYYCTVGFLEGDGHSHCDHLNNGILTFLVFRIGGRNNQCMREHLDFAGSNKFRFSLPLPNGKRFLQGKETLAFADTR